MTAVDKLIRHAHEKMVWQQNAAKHRIFAPARMSAVNGALGVFRGLKESHRLPTHDYYILYTLNQLHPKEVGLTESQNELGVWTSLEQLANNNKLVCMVYMGQRLIPASAVWLRVTKTNEFLVAVKTGIRLGPVDVSSQLKIKTFDAYWEVTNGLAEATPYENASVALTAVTDANGLLTKAYDMSKTHRLLFHNGFLVEEFNTSNLQNGDTLIAIKDFSISVKVDIPLTELKSFPVDRLSIPLPMSDRERPVPVGEVDVFVMAETTEGDRKGVLLDRFKEGELGQLTHQDLFISKEKLETCLAEFPDEYSGSSLRIVIRRTAVKRLGEPRVPGNYLTALYRLNAGDRQTLMFPVVDTESLWDAAALATSNLWRWTEKQYAETDDISRLKDVFSYEELCRFFCEGPDGLKTFYAGTGDVRPACTLPPLAEVGGMLLPYDAEGIMLGSIRVSPGKQGEWAYLPEETVKVRFIPGNFGSNGLGWDKNIDVRYQSSPFGEVFYRAEEGQRGWQLAHIGEDYTIDKSGLLTWTAPPNKASARMRRAIEDSAYKSLEISPALLYKPIRFLDDLPVSELDLSHTEVYLNGYFLVRGVDYDYDFPTITITNKSYYFANAKDEPVRIEIFHYGLPDQSYSLYDTGFIRNRRMTDNGTHLGLDMGQSGFVDGKFAYVEGFDLLDVQGHHADPNHREGGLYCRMGVTPAISPWVRQLFSCVESTHQEVTSLVRPLLEEPVDTTRHIFIPYAHNVYSPTFYRILTDLKKGTLDSNVRRYDDAVMAALLVDYAEQIANDIANRPFTWDILDLSISPISETIEVTLAEYKFLDEVNRFAFNGRFNLNSQLHI